MAQPNLKTDDDQREKIFMDILTLLWSGRDFKSLSEEAGVSISTLYNWAELKTIKPRIDTLCKVARVLGYEIALVKIKKVRKLRSVK